MAKDERVTYFAETDFRSRKIRFGIRPDDRARHMYVIGKTGMGKSTLLENLAVQDIQSGEGICFIDPHGGSAETLLKYVPPHRMKDVVYFAPFDIENPVSMNVMEDIGKDKRSFVASGLISAFKKVWVDAWSARMEYILNNTILALLETPGATLLGVNRMLSDKAYRDMIVGNITDPSVRAFWVDEFAKYSEKFMVEAGAAIQNKVGQFSANPLIRNIVGQPKSSFDMRKIMDERKILIVNLSKGLIGEGNANLLGSMLITKLYLAAMSRADVPEQGRAALPPFYLYVDEFQSFANESFANILSEARKYKLALTIAHQYIEQMSDEVRAAVFGNVGTMITFRVGSYDAEVLEKEFAPAFTAEDIVNLGFAQIYLRLMIGGVGSHPFSATTLPPVSIPLVTHEEQVKQASRELYARPRSVVEGEIEAWHAPIPGSEDRRDGPPTKKYAPGMRPSPSGQGERRSYGPPQDAAPRRAPAPQQYADQASAQAYSQAPSWQGQQDQRGFAPQGGQTQAPRIAPGVVPVGVHAVGTSFSEDRPVRPRPAVDASFGGDRSSRPRPPSSLARTEGDTRNDRPRPLDPRPPLNDRPRPAPRNEDGVAPSARGSGDASAGTPVHRPFAQAFAGTTDDPSGPAPVVPEEVIARSRPSLPVAERRGERAAAPGSLSWQEGGERPRRDPSTSLPSSRPPATGGALPTTQNVSTLRAALEVVRAKDQDTRTSAPKETRRQPDAVTPPIVPVVAAPVALPPQEKPAGPGEVPESVLRSILE